MKDTENSGQAVPIIGGEYWAVRRLLADPPTVLQVRCVGFDKSGIRLVGARTNEPIGGALRCYNHVGEALHQCHMELARDLKNLADTMGRYAKEAWELSVTYDTLIVAEPATGAPLEIPEAPGVAK